MYSSDIIITITFQCCLIRKLKSNSVHSKHIKMRTFLFNLLPSCDCIFLRSLFVLTKIYVSFSFCFSSSEYLIPFQCNSESRPPDLLQIQLPTSSTIPQQLQSTQNKSPTHHQPQHSRIRHHRTVLHVFGNKQNQTIFTLQLCARQMLRLNVHALLPKNSANQIWTINRSNSANSK